MASTHHLVVYVVSRAVYDNIVGTLPATGNDYDVEYRIMFAEKHQQLPPASPLAGDFVENGQRNESFTFTWLNGKWNPPVNLRVV